MENKLKFDPATIKWEEAPEGYYVWLQDTKPHVGRDTSGWYLKEPGGYLPAPGQNIGGSWSLSNEGEAYTVHTRLAKLRAKADLSVAWDGTGNPPVGAIVYTTHAGVETQVRILGYSKHRSGKDAVTYEDAKTGELYAFIAEQCEFRLESAATKAERSALEGDIIAAGGMLQYGAKELAEHLHKLGYRRDAETQK